MVNTEDDLYLDLFPWNKNFETGNTKIDEQHQVLIRLLNELAATLTREEPVKINEAFEALTKYASFHFAEEEAIWREYFEEDDLFYSHQRQHVSFLPQIEDLKARNADKSIRYVGVEMIKFLVRWLVFHIIDDDKRLAVVVEEMKNGASLESAKEKAEQSMSGSVGALIETMMLMYDSLSARTLSLLRERNERIRLETELIESNERLEQLSVTDQLTGLNNRRSFEKIFRSEVRRARRDKHHLNLVVMDIDHFKTLNDTYGHAEGDVALASVAECLKKTCRRPDDFAFRIGGEEFAVICSGESKADALDFAEMIRKNIAALNIPNKESSVGEYLTVSIGVVVISPTQKEVLLDSCFKSADKSLYLAKDSGRNKVIVDGA